MSIKTPLVFSWLRVTRLDEIRHYWHGRRDGRKKIPFVETAHNDGDGQTDLPLRPTPHEQTLVHRRDEVIARVRQELVETVDSTYRQIDERYQQLSTVEDELSRLREELDTARVDLSETDLSRRGAGEDALPDGTIRTRRKAERDRQIAPLAAAVDAKEQQIEAAQAELAKLEAEITVQVRRFQSRADQYAAYVEGLDMRYWRALLRAHPAREHLEKRTRQWPAPPEWTAIDDYRAALELGPPPGGQVTQPASERR